jgi:Uma2 family endonuclease
LRIAQYNPLQYLPSFEELPDSDDTPVDNELQVLNPYAYCEAISLAPSERQDWFFGVNMGVYYQPNQQAIVPDGFL